MVNSISANDLGKALANGNNLTISHDDVDGNEGKINGAHPAYSPSKTSREGSINGDDLVYASIEAMSQGKCGVGAEIYEVCFIQLYLKTHHVSLIIINFYPRIYFMILYST